MGRVIFVFSLEGRSDLATQRCQRYLLNDYEKREEKQRKQEAVAVVLTYCGKFRLRRCHHGEEGKCFERTFAIEMHRAWARLIKK